MNNKKDKEKLIDYVMKNDICRIQRLLENGADPNQTDDDARVTPLHYAVQNNFLEVAKLLITAGANLTAKTSDGQTLMEIAKLYNHTEMIIFLSSAHLLKLNTRSLSTM